MSVTKVRSLALAAALGLGLLTAAEAQAAPVFVGSWDLGNIDGNYDNPNNPWIWTNNPPVLSGVEAAAMLFGGSPSDYAISTIDSNPANINNLAFLDGWGDTQYLFNPQSETFKLDSGPPGYNDPYGGPAYSAYVVDHAAFAGPPGTFVNYAFRLDTQAVPEPSTLASLAVASLIGAGTLLRRRKR